MALKETSTDKLVKDYESAWAALRPLRDTWEEKEQALLAKTTDTFSGTVTRARVTDAALSTYAFERQARVAAQLPTGKVYPAGKKDEGKAKLANTVLSRYIIPNAGRGFDMLTLQRMWGIYSSVYGSMPMFYDYCVEDDYIGPYAALVDPRMFLPQPGRNSIKECDWVMISTIVNVSYLESIVKRKNSSWNLSAVKRLLEEVKKTKARPSRYDDAEKDPHVSRIRYSKDSASGQIELVTCYESGEKGHWKTFSPDYKDVGLLRDIPNPHKSGKIPVVMRHCFPLMNSIYGLGDFERGMRIQKAKDSFLGLRLEYAKNMVFPPMKVNLQNVTPSTIKWGSNQKMLVTDMNNSVQLFEPSGNSLNEFQNVFAVLNGIQQNQFGTSDTSVSSDNSGDPTMGKTPQALKMQNDRENARDTWDRFMHEKAVEELYEGMINLLCVKMEKPINFTVFEEEIRQLVDDYGDDVLEVIAGGKYGSMTIPKRYLHSDKSFKYIIDANSSVRQDDEAQVKTLIELFQIMANPGMNEMIQQFGYSWNAGEHIKSIFTNSGVTDWERILQEGVEGGMPMAPEQPMEPPMEPMQPMEQPVQDQPSFIDPDIQSVAQQILGGA